MLLIGIDGGASKISGWNVIFNQKDGTFSLGDTNIVKEYRNYLNFISDFVPVSLPVQLEEMNSKINLTDDEILQGSIYIQACADVITEFANKYPEDAILVGIGMPGLKSGDKRGIVALANGPRMPKYAQKVEGILKGRGVNLFSNISVLGSDADYCGIGEEYSEEGEFRNAGNAYYLGGGTGVADAMKLGGKLMPFDMIKEWMPKTWEIKSDGGLSMERYTSASGIQYIYSLNSGIALDILNDSGVFPPQILERAISGEVFAIRTLEQVSGNLAHIIFEKITTLYFGWQDHFEFVNPNKKIELKNHAYIGTKLDRIIIGQRLGDLFEQSINTGFLFDQFNDYLSEMINNVDDIDFKKYYLHENKFRKELIKISKLREAPALGAAIDAYLKNID